MGAKDIFGTSGAFTRYYGEGQVRYRLCGGVPKDPDTIKKWLQARLEMEDRAILELAAETEAAMAEETGTRPSADDLIDALASKVQAGNGFKRANGSLIYEGRCLKAAIKEAANIAYPGTTPWPGKPKEIRKGLENFMAERVFVEEDGIPLGVSEPSWTEQRIKHIKTPKGPRSAINVVDIVEKPMLSFHVKVLDDCIKPEVWGRIWETLEENGIGADRRRGDGGFELVRWERL